MFKDDDIWEVFFFRKVHLLHFWNVAKDSTTRIMIYIIMGFLNRENSCTANYQGVNKLLIKGWIFFAFDGCSVRIFKEVKWWEREVLVHSFISWGWWELMGEGVFLKQDNSLRFVEVTSWLKLYTIIRKKFTPLVI